MNPSVGLTVSTSSSINFLTIVVLPALSRPLKWHQQDLAEYPRQSTDSIKILISLSLNRALRRIESIVLTIVALVDLKCCFRRLRGLLEMGSGLPLACCPTTVVVALMLASLMTTTDPPLVLRQAFDHIAIGVPDMFLPW